MGLCCCKLSNDAVIDDTTGVVQAQSTPRDTTQVVTRPPTVRPLQTIPPIHPIYQDQPSIRVIDRTKFQTETKSPIEACKKRTETGTKKSTSTRKELKLFLNTIERANSRKQITRDEGMLVTFLQKLQVPHKLYVPSTEAYTLEPVHQNTRAYGFVMSQFRNAKFNNTYIVSKICRVWNPYIFCQYLLNKNKGGAKFKERHLFHGTDPNGMRGILTHNFDWRVVENGRCGWGVSFANNPWFASHYSIRRHNGCSDYVMILAKVLVEDGNLCIGDKSTILPSAGHTTTNEKKEVLVKYEDGCFYPEFVVYFKRRINHAPFQNEWNINVWDY